MKKASGIIIILLVFLFSLNVCDAEGPTIHEAVKRNNLDQIKAMIDKGVTVDKADKYGNTPLFYAGTLEIAKFLVTKGADINIRNSYGNTPVFGIIMWAGLSDELKEIICYLEQKGAKLDIENDLNETLLYQAVTYSTAEIVELLLKKGAIEDLNRKDMSGNTPLHIAARMGEAETVKLLIRSGANLFARNSENETPLDLARKEKDNLEVCQILEKIIREKTAEYKAKIAAVEKFVVRQYDEMEDISWYFAKGTEVFAIPDFIFYPYIGKNQNDVWLRFRAGLCRNNYSFFTKILLLADGKRFQIDFDKYQDQKDEDTSNGIYEWIDISVDENLLQILGSVSNAKQVKIRFAGDKSADCQLSDEQKRQIGIIVDYYKYMLTKK